MATNKQQIWRVVDLLLWTKEYLRSKGSEAPQIEAEWLLRAVLHCSRLEIYMRHEQPLTPAELAQFKELLLKRVAGQPIQYVLGSAEFMDLTLEVTPAVLIPRPETEILVERLLEKMAQMPRRSYRILDIGTGSGCIALTLARHCQHCEILAIDVSQPALTVARRNAQHLGLDERVVFQQLDILKELPPTPPLFDIIVSNPPYVAGEWIERLPEVVRRYEPTVALFPGDDDLLFYRRIRDIAPQLLVPDGWIALEIGGTYQAKAVTELFASGRFLPVEIFQDYGGESRAIITGLAQ